MNVLDTLKYTGERLQIPVAIGNVAPSGEISLLYVNSPCAVVFGYASPAAMVGMKVEALMPRTIAQEHQQYVADYHRRANGGTKRAGGVMDRWRELDGVRRDGSTVPILLNVADIRNSEERYYLAVFYDRTADVAAARERADERKREMDAIIEAQHATQKALEDAEKARETADKLRVEADVARHAAEDGLLKQKRLAGQITLLRQVFAGTMFLVALLGALVVAQWSTGGSADGLSMVKDILLVLTGILGSAMASVFDSRNGRATGE